MNPRRIPGLVQRRPRPLGAIEQPPGFWSQYGGEIIVGVITAVASAVATYLAMRAIERRR